MVTSYVLVGAATGQALEAREAIEAIEGVGEAHVVAGDYDVVAEAEGESTADLFRDTIAEIRNVEAVGDTKTYMAID